LEELAHVLSASIQVDRVAAEIARFAMRFVDAAGAAVALVNQEAQALQVVAAEGSLTGCLGRTVGADTDGIILKAIGHERLEMANTERADGVLLCPKVSARSAIAAPLRAHGVTTGAVVVADRPRAPFNDLDARLVSTLAGHAAVVLSNASFFEMVRRGKEQWEATFDALDEGIALVDAQGRVRRANAAFARTVRAPIPAVIGGQFGRMLFGDQAASDELLRLAAEKGHGSLVRRSEKLGRILRVASAPVTRYSADTAAVVVVEDITDQKAMEAQLIQSEKMAAVGTLVSGVAHELNNPLTSIAGLSEFLLEQQPDARQAEEHLKVINDQAERASRIVRNLLSFARKGTPSERAPLDLADMVQRTVLLMGYELKLRGVTVETTLASGVPPAMGNRDEVQQVLLNLLTNATQAVAALPPEAERRVRITVRREGAAGVLSVADTGPGIPPEALPHIFDPFYTTKPLGEGTGLGLFLAYGIVEAHGGSLTVDSRPGEGAVFTISLPLAPSEPRPAVSGAPADRVGRKRRILVVDDDPAVRRMVAALFTSDGHVVDAPAGAAEALALAQQGEYDLVVADHRAAAGRERFAAALARVRPAWGARTILAASEPRRESARQGQAGQLLRKPINLKDLRAAAARVWDASPEA
jgi:two-component system NtrC family sensor kinase